MELNAKLVNTETHTGVYVDNNRKSAIVVRVKNGIVHYVTMQTGSVTLQSCSTEKFEAQFNTKLYHYPVRRACRVYMNSGLGVSNEAAAILRAVLN